MNDGENRRSWGFFGELPTTQLHSVRVGKESHTKSESLLESRCEHKIFCLHIQQGLSVGLAKTQWVKGYLRYQLLQILCLSTINPTSSQKCCWKISERFSVQKKMGERIFQNFGLPFSKTSSTYKLTSTSWVPRPSLHEAWAHLAGPIPLLGSFMQENTGLDGEIMDDVSVLPKQESKIHKKISR